VSGSEGQPQPIPNGLHMLIARSADGNVYMWDRYSGRLLETLSGHGQGSVNAVAWNPRYERVFASCSDDQEIRIWEAAV
jgi:WD repeat-containing protein 26